MSIVVDRRHLLYILYFYGGYVSRDLCFWNRAKKAGWGCNRKGGKGRGRGGDEGRGGEPREGRGDPYVGYVKGRVTTYCTGQPAD